MLNGHSILFRTDNRRLDYFIRRDYIIAEDFIQQWSVEKKSRFIESILARIPVIPNFICEELPSGKLKIIFGIEEYLCLKQFINNEFELVNCEYVFPIYDFDGSVNGLNYKKLINLLKNRLSDLYITIYSYDANSHNSDGPEIKRNLFDNVMQRIAEFK